MFAAASGARLAHRHNKAVRKQISQIEAGQIEAGQIEGLQVHCKGYQRQQQFKYADEQGNRFAGIPHRRPNYSSKLYCDSNLKLSSSYIDINGRIAKLGHVDFEGKAAWQDRELNHELDARESICVPSETVVTHRTKQREAHRRWVKRNRIHDLSFGECSSEEELLYGVQNGAANLLLYVGLGTMCVGMIIAFVGTGEKGFKTMELRLIGPSLIGAGVLIIVLRIMLCVCPSKCLKLKKHKQKLKNSTNKLNSEGNQTTQENSSSKEPLSEDSTKDRPEKSEGKKRVSIAMLPTTSGLSTNSSDNIKGAKRGAGAGAGADSPGPFAVPAISFVENEKASRRRDTSTRKLSSNSISSENKEEEERTDLELRQLDGSDCDAKSFGSESSFRRNFSNFPETLVSPDNSDISITSLVNISPLPEIKKEKTSKFEVSRTCKNVAPMEIVLSPSTLNDTKEGD